MNEFWGIPRPIVGIVCSVDSFSWEDQHLSYHVIFSNSTWKDESDMDWNQIVKEILNEEPDGILEATHNIPVSSE